jgi:hypothetical protein
MPSFKKYLVFYAILFETALHLTLSSDTSIQYITSLPTPSISLVIMISKEGLGLQSGPLA